MNEPSLWKRVAIEYNPVIPLLQRNNPPPDQSESRTQQLCCLLFSCYIYSVKFFLFVSSLRSSVFLCWVFSCWVLQFFIRCWKFTQADFPPPTGCRRKRFPSPGSWGHSNITRGSDLLSEVHREVCGDDRPRRPAHMTLNHLQLPSNKSTVADVEWMMM